MQISYLRDKLAGGRRAATDLYEKIYDFVSKKEGKEDDDHRIFVQIFLNLAGLQSVLGPHCQLAAFAQSFNRSAYPMSIVDTGHTRRGDQAADLALKSFRSGPYAHLASVHERLTADLFRAQITFDFLVPQPTTSCSEETTMGATDMLLQLGVSSRRKVTLLQTGTFIAPEIKELNLPMAQFPTIFRSRDQRQPLEPVGEGPAAPVVLAIPAPTSSNTPNYAPLIAAVRSSPFPKPFRSQIGSMLVKHKPKLYTSFEVYCKGAERAGLVELGRTEGTVGADWIRLVEVSLTWF
ncbi:hypothetical protein RQP46_004666 [Phenoliferia psychrophenolica]